jgi:hypothetical protein
MGFNVKNLKSALEGGTSKNGGIEIWLWNEETVTLYGVAEE